MGRTACRMDVTDHRALFREKTDCKSSSLTFDVTVAKPFASAPLPRPVRERAQGLHSKRRLDSGNKVWRRMLPYRRLHRLGFLCLRGLLFRCPRPRQRTGQPEGGGGQRPSGFCNVESPAYRTLKARGRQSVVQRWRCKPDFPTRSVLLLTRRPSEPYQNGISAESRRTREH